MSLVYYYYIIRVLQISKMFKSLFDQLMFLNMFSSASVNNLGDNVDI